MLVTWHHRPVRRAGPGTECRPDVLRDTGLHDRTYAIHTVDLITRDWWDINGVAQPPNKLEQLYPGETPKGWNANPLVRGLEFRATTEGASLPLEIDWVRLVPADHQTEAKFLRVRFTGCTSPRLRISDAEGTYILPVHSVNAGELAFNYGVLAPGSYTMGLQCNEGASTNTQPLVINAPPLVTVVNPDAAGGEDFATSELKNAWDMDSLADVVVTGVENVPAPQTSGNALIATATDGGDPQVTLLNGGTSLISTRRYRNITFTLELDTTFGLSGNAGDGSMARVFWGSQNNQAANAMTTTNDLLVWPGRNTYTVDLSTLTLANLGLEPECVAGVGCPQIPWAQHSVRFFRIDPHEATKNVVFRMGPVSLTAPDEVDTGGTFNVQFKFTDPDAGAAYDAAIWLEDSIGARQSLGTMPNVAKDIVHTFPYNVPADHIPGEYRIYVQVTEKRAFHNDTSDVSHAHSTGPLRIYNAAVSTPKTIISSPVSNTTQPTPFSIRGCAYDDGNNLGINVDDILAFAIAGPNVTGVQAGTTQVLGLGHTLGNLVFGP